jgi:hypothetical protein
MANPLDAITAIHNAFRRDIEGIDAAALGTARGTAGLEATLERFRFLNEVLVWHAKGEETAIFPAVEAVAPLVSESYEQDHRGLDAAFAALNDAVSRRDALGTARATAAFKFHLDLHLSKEDTHLYRIVRERIPPRDQGKAVGIMAGEVPPDRQPELIAWMFPLLGHDDRENMLRVQKMVLPPEVFAAVAGLVRRAVGDDWVELTRRIPELGS